MDAVQSIALFNTLFYVFLGIAILGLVLAVFFFFYFDIRKLRSEMTGKAREKSIRQVTEQNAKTGSLKYQYPGITKETKTGKTNKGKTNKVVSTTSMGQQSVETANETAVLQTVTAETSVLQNEATETSVLTNPNQQQSDMGQTVPLSKPTVKYNHFQVTQSVIVIHTEEII